MPILKGISPNMNVIVPLEFKLIYNNNIIQNISQYMTGTPPPLYYGNKPTNIQIFRLFII